MSVMTEAVIGPGAAPARAPALEPTYEGDFVLDQHLMLESGRTLAQPTLHYAVYGRLNAARDNAVLICHALSGSARVGDWWPEIFAPGAVLSLEHDFVICINLLGSCYGSTGPGSVDPATGLVYGPDFPLVSIRDNVHAQAQLLDSLGIRRLRLALGGSIGGMQALEWAIYDPARVERAAIIAVAPLSAMGLALNHLQRQAIQNDPEWDSGYYLPQRQPHLGLSLARQIGMLSYKSAGLFDERFSRNPNRNGENPWGLDNQGGGLIGGRFDIAGYLDHQGERFIQRFDANSYLAISAHHGYLGSPQWSCIGKGRIRPYSRPPYLYRHQFRLAFPSGVRPRLCRPHPFHRRSSRVSGNDQFPRSRRLSRRTGRVSSTPAVTLTRQNRVLLHSGNTFGPFGV